MPPPPLLPLTDAVEKEDDEELIAGVEQEVLEHDVGHEMLMTSVRLASV